MTAVMSSVMRKLDDNDFLRDFARDPSGALARSGIGMGVSEFCDELNKDPNLYEDIVNKVADVVGITKLAPAASSCCE